MKIGYQWAMADGSISDWQWIDSRLWHTLPKKPLPVSGKGQETIDDKPGWVQAVNIMGMVEMADHIAIEHVHDTKVILHNFRVDPEDYHEDERIAHVTVFETLAQEFKRFGGAYNTRIRRIVYAGDRVKRPWRDSEAELRPFRQYRLPPGSITRHGVWMLDKQWRRHMNALSVKGWRTWTQGLPGREIVHGRLREQRKEGRFVKPDGTRTYYARDTARANGTHVANQENAFETTTGSPTEELVSINQSSDLLAFCMSTPSGEPDSGAWPTGNYRYQIDVTTGTTDINCGLSSVGGSTGHFARQNSGLTSDLETKAMAESNFNSTGLHLATTGSVSWSSGAASDRFECLVAAENTRSHGARDIGVTFNETDDFADGPWSAAASNQQLPLWFAQPI